MLSFSSAMHAKLMLNSAVLCCVCFRFIYSAFLTVICLLCPAIIIWLDPWTWRLWGPEMMFLVRHGTSHGPQIAVVSSSCLATNWIACPLTLAGSCTTQIHHLPVAAALLLLLMATLVPAPLL